MKIIKVGIFVGSVYHTKVGRILSFAKGVEKCGDKALIYKGYNYQDCDVAVMVAFPSFNENDEGNIIRQNIMNHHKGRTVHIDGPLLQKYFPDPYFRVSYDSVYYSKADYVNQNSSNDRWNSLLKLSKYQPTPWRTNGDHILLLLQRQKGWMMKQVDNIEWGLKAIKRIREVSNRKILVRPHPSQLKLDQSLEKFKNLENVELSNSNNTLRDDLKNCWCSVTFNSSAPVENIFCGVPVFMDDIDGIIYDASIMDWSKIEDQNHFDPSQWFSNLAYCMWTEEEIASGIVWKRFRNYYEK